MNEVEAMKASAPPPPKAQQPVSLDDVRKAAEEFATKRPAESVTSAVPIEPVGTFAVTYRSPTSGAVQSASLTARVLLKTDERMLVWQVAYATLGIPWDRAPAFAREEAYAQATCRVQWDEDATVPAWVRTAYMEDNDFAMALAQEVDNLSAAYFRGNPRQGEPSSERRFVVLRSKTPA